MAEFSPILDVGSLSVLCPECLAVIPITVRAELTVDDRGQAFVNTQPDLTDVWAHSFTHD